MAIKPQSLNNRERDLTIDDRIAVPSSFPTPDGSELEAIRARLQRAKQSATIAQSRSRMANRNKCECFERGWMAAIAEIETGSAS